MIGGKESWGTTKRAMIPNTLKKKHLQATLKKKITEEDFFGKGKHAKFLTGRAKSCGRKAIK